MELIRLDGVTKAFYANRRKDKASIALDGVSLSIDEGEFVSLIGPSGCGKTVTLSMIAGFMQPTLGTVRFKGSPICGPSPQRGVVFQGYSLFPWLSVEQNVMFALRSSARKLGRKIDKSQMRERAAEALSQVGLAQAAKQRPNTLSGGMKQRVAIARLLAMDSEVFLMDEPFSALDEQTRNALDKSLFQLWKRKRKTVVFVTHNISEAVQISSRIVLFSQSPGRIIKQWEVPPDLDRDLGSPAIRGLAAEILSFMPSSACSFGGDAQEQAGGAQ